MRVDLTNQRFGRLLVLSKYDVIGKGETRWLCRCDCGNECVVSRGGLKGGKTQSCGCLQRERTSEIKRKYNTYDLSGEYGIGYTSKGEEFYFDLEDYDKIKDYCWCFNDQDYVVAHNKSGNNIRLHRLILNINDKDIIIDHKNRRKNDNRKSNLRIATKSENAMNRPADIRSTTGYKGVHKVGNKYTANIGLNNETIYLGIFDSMEDAAECRYRNEKEIFGEFAYNEEVITND